MRNSPLGSIDRLGLYTTATKTLPAAGKTVAGRAATAGGFVTGVAFVHAALVLWELETQGLSKLLGEEMHYDMYDVTVPQPEFS
ncbi:MAG: hypothetical protein ACFBZ8_02335 [Opitutales bacterium]